MDRIVAIFGSSADDPLYLVVLFLLAWVPICGIGLAVLAVLAGVEERVTRHGRPRRTVELPPAEVRPLAARRYMTDVHPSGSVATARLLLAIAGVAAFTVVALLSTGQALLTALGH